MDILDWSKNFIEKPNEYLGNVPVCHYAAKARQDNALKVLEVTKNYNLIDKIVEGTELIKDPKIYFPILVFIILIILAAIINKFLFNNKFSK